MLNKIIAHNQVLKILSAQSSVPTFPVEDSLVSAPLDSEEIARVNQLVLTELFAFQNQLHSRWWADGNL